MLRDNHQMVEELWNEWQNHDQVTMLHPHYVLAASRTHLGETVAIKAQRPGSSSLSSQGDTWSLNKAQTSAWSPLSCPGKLPGVSSQYLKEAVSPAS